ncbi:Uncharacterized protein YoxC, contains an MCP-like domain [Mesobacillus persicus]|uniref:Uncharacterized protein YoxC, contains an MCP-like domain n=1 Tax=Mesobacillus persicus TaxID=930146 RepID=A0A1H7XZD9_9BACI|nr:DUF948 domain-containing protein [Mesobacillus persicus]SEM38984.1 Uncharacterized protein YoxC, contains an MCP-like domain [Mesobacillus persicus]
MELILYLSAALAAIAFFILVIYLAKTLKSLQATLNSVAHTLTGLEKQLDGVTRETTELLHKTNTLAEDIQQKSENLNSVVIAVKDVGSSVQRFNHTIQNITAKVEQQVDKNQDKISQVVQWSNVFLELKERWQARKTSSSDHHLEGEQILARQRERANH